MNRNSFLSEFAFQMVSVLPQMRALSNIKPPNYDRFTLLPILKDNMASDCVDRKSFLQLAWWIQDPAAAIRPPACEATSWGSELSTPLHTWL